MIQLNILSGKQAGSQFVVRRFPFTGGRDAGNDLRLDDDGVWDKHFTLELQKSEGFKLVAAASALAAVNNQPVQNAILHNGDVITIGSVKLQFWLAPAKPRDLRLRESLVWALLALVTLSQFILIYWLLR